MKFIALKFQNGALDNEFKKVIPILLIWIFGISGVKIHIAMQ